MQCSSCFRKWLMQNGSHAIKAFWQSLMEFTEMWYIPPCFRVTYRKYKYTLYIWNLRNLRAILKPWPYLRGVSIGHGRTQSRILLNIIERSSSNRSVSRHWRKFILGCRWACVRWSGPGSSGMTREEFHLCTVSFPLQLCARLKRYSCWPLISMERMNLLLISMVFSASEFCCC